MINEHLSATGKSLDSYLSNCEKILIIDFNSEITESSMHEICNLYNLNSLCNEPTCYKNPEKPSCILIFNLQAPQDPSKIPEQLKLAYLSSTDLQEQF